MPGAPDECGGRHDRDAELAGADEGNEGVGREAAYFSLVGIDASPFPNVILYGQMNDSDVFGNAIAG